jgi:hypothetical protein
MEGHVTGRYWPELDQRFAMANPVTGVVCQLALTPAASCGR